MLNFANLLDYFIVIVMMISVLMGVARGLIKEIISLIVWSAAIIIAVLYCQPASMFLKHTIPDVNIDLIISFILIMFIVLTIGNMLSNVIQKFINPSNFSIIDRLTGCLFGGVRGITIIALAMVLLKATNLIQEYKIQNHKLINYFTPAALWLDKQLPAEFKHIKIPTVLPEAQASLPPNNEQHLEQGITNHQATPNANQTTNLNDLSEHEHPQNSEHQTTEAKDPETNAPHGKHKK